MKAPCSLHSPVPDHQAAHAEPARSPLRRPVCTGVLRDAGAHATRALPVVMRAACRRHMPLSACRRRACRRTPPCAPATSGTARRTGTGCPAPRPGGAACGRGAPRRTERGCAVPGSAWVRTGARRVHGCLVERPARRAGSGRGRGARGRQREPAAGHAHLPAPDGRLPHRARAAPHLRSQVRALGRPGAPAPPPAPPLSARPGAWRAGIGSCSTRCWRARRAWRRA